MTDSHGSSGPPAPAPGPGAAGQAGPPALDPVAVIRATPYLAALILAGILGIPISAIAYGFLALVSKIITDHGALIRVDSRPGRTVFRISLPKA